MNTVSKVAAFAAAIAVTFGGAMAVGAAVGPIDVSGGGHDPHGAMTADTQGLPRGLALAEGGYRLAVETDTVPAGAATTFVFRIVGDNADSVTRFQTIHDRPLHLIVLSRNLVDYLHLHPTMDSSGRWTVELPALNPGSYRVFADFQPDGADNITLGTDLDVPGMVPAVALPAPSSVATVDGYAVTLAGMPAVGAEELSFTVRLDGETVRTDPYLGAAGHLVAIRDGDLAYLHVHPHEGATGQDVTFTGEFPTAGRYRLFFDFSHTGSVHTAAFTVDVPSAGHGAEPSTDPHPSDTTAGH
ncbi:MAG: hypothetical protein ABI949_06090 [Ilumatobacteraceae bacterium]